MALDRRAVAYVALSVMGIAVAVYHGYGEITFTVLSGACNISSVFSCGSVFASGFTTFPPAGSIPGLGTGIEFWVYGVVWFPLCAILGLWAIRNYGGPKRSIFVPFLMIGNIFTLYPWDIEIRFLQGHYCLICISMYIINYIMTFIAFSYNPLEPEAAIAGA